MTSYPRSKGSVRLSLNGRKRRQGKTFVFYPQLNEVFSKPVDQADGLCKIECVVEWGIAVDTNFLKAHAVTLSQPCGERRRVYQATIA